MEKWKHEQRRDGPWHRASVSISIPQPERHTGRIVASVACILVFALGLGVALALSQGLIRRPAPTEDDRTAISTPPPKAVEGTEGGETEPLAGEQEDTTEDEQKQIVELPAVLHDLQKLDQQVLIYPLLINQHVLIQHHHQ